MTKADRLEAALARERKKMAEMVTIDEVEGYMRGHLAGFVNGENVFEPAEIEHNEALWDAIENLRDKKDGLAAHAKRKHEDEG